MEDHTQSKTQSAKTSKEKIVDLTADMELPDQTQHKIFNLTKDPDGAKDIAEEQAAVDTLTVDKADTPQAQTMITPDSDDVPDRKPAEDRGDIPEETAASALEIETRKDALVEETSGPPAEEVLDATVSEKSNSIEAEVDAAFDAFQGGLTEPVEEKKTDDQIFDKLSNITQEVDNAVRQIKETDSPIAVENGAIEPLPIDEEALSSDAADLKTAMAGAGEENGIVELTEVVGSADRDESDTAEKPDDDIIELVDRVDPAELASIKAEAAEDGDDIIELTDIVDPAEIAAGDMDGQPAEQVVASAGRVETDDLFEGDLNLEEALARKAQPGVDDIGTGVMPDVEETDEQQEQVIQLADVLGGGAEEDIAKQHISMDAEETANTMGMGLVEKTEKEQQILSEKEIERTVEHIIQSKYADTIERMVAKAVEKAVTQEIEKIKRSLSDDEPPT